MSQRKLKEPKTAKKQTSNARRAIDIYKILHKVYSNVAVKSSELFTKLQMSGLIEKLPSGWTLTERGNKIYTDMNAMLIKKEEPVVAQS